MPNALYSVRTEQGRVVVAAVEPMARHRIVRIISGDRVAIKVSTYDPNRGQITKKL